MRNAERSGWFSWRNFALFAGGAAVAVIASRILPPIAAQGMGRAYAAAGGDPFDALVQDHRKILNLLAEMERSPRGAVAERTELLLRLKRQLTAHALAEEDVVYPLLHDRAGQVSDTKRLYREHADMKMHLFRLEQTPKDDPRWIDTLREVRALIAEHIEQEEEVDFPTLRSLLDSQDRARLSGGVQREKSFVL